MGLEGFLELFECVLVIHWHPGVFYYPYTYLAGYAVNCLEQSNGEPPSGENPIFPIASIYMQFREKLTSAVVRRNGCTDIRPYGGCCYTVAPRGLHVAAGS